MFSLWDIWSCVICTWGSQVSGVTAHLIRGVTQTVSFQNSDFHVNQSHHLFLSFVLDIVFFKNSRADKKSHSKLVCIVERRARAARSQASVNTGALRLMLPVPASSTELQRLCSGHHQHESAPPWRKAPWCTSMFSSHLCLQPKQGLFQKQSFHFLSCTDEGQDHVWVPSERSAALHVTVKSLIWSLLTLFMTTEIQRFFLTHV